MLHQVQFIPFVPGDVGPVALPAPPDARHATSMRPAVSSCRRTATGEAVAARCRSRRGNCRRSLGSCCGMELTAGHFERISRMLSTVPADQPTTARGRWLALLLTGLTAR